MQTSRTRSSRRWPSRAALTLASALALTLAAGCSGGGGDTTPNDGLDDARALYGQYCALCHGEDGQGYVADGANALANQNFLATASDALIRNGIVLGRPGTSMSPWGEAWGGPLSDADVDRIVALIRSWQRVDDQDVDGVVVEGSATRAEPTWAVFCADCHGEAGGGGTFMTVNNPVFLADASDGFLRHAIAEGRSPTPMAGYAGQLTDQQIDDLVVLIRGWETPPNTEPPELPELDPSAIVLNPEGPEPAFEGVGDGRYLPADTVKAELDKGARMVLIDARPPADYVRKHITGAISVPFYAVDQAVEVLPEDAWIVTYCACPHAESGEAADALIEAGFETVRVLDEGVLVWEERGYPMSTSE